MLKSITPAMSSRIVTEATLRRSLLCLSFCLSALLVPARAQNNIQYTNGNIDAALRGGLNVDPSTLGMSFSVTMGGYPGRGLSLPVTLNYGSKVWRIHYLTSWESQVQTWAQTTGMFAENSVSGWTASVDVPWIEYTGGNQAYDAAGQPICNGCEGVYYAYYIEKLVVHMPDGSSHEMRKSDTPVGRYLTDGPPPLAGIYRSVDSVAGVL
jgi:hypothetical protein